ncbi:hypothetical protein AYO49_04630 [Verrucomicrobiaceae bacterium SCGC AG-212-N21]|nr:hypothetical protein AYO49_04630 [Verrucomicrobiaceae bacterium SCGC AG-212-N21]
MKLDSLLTELSRRLGVPEAKLNTQGSCALVLDGKTTLHIDSIDAGSDEAVFSAQICTYPDDDSRGPLFELLMDLHYLGIGTRGGHFSASRETGRVLFSKRVDLVPMTIDSLIEAIREFTEVFDGAKAVADALLAGALVEEGSGSDAGIPEISTRI